MIPKNLSAVIRLLQVEQNSFLQLALFSDTLQFQLEVDFCDLIKY